MCASNITKIVLQEYALGIVTHIHTFAFHNLSKLQATTAHTRDALVNVEYINTKALVT